MAAEAGEVRLATPEDEWSEVKAILVDQAECGETAGQLGSGNIDLTVELRFERAHKRSGVVADKSGIRPDGF